MITRPSWISDDQFAQASQVAGEASNGPRVACLVEGHASECIRRSTISGGGGGGEGGFVRNTCMALNLSLYSQALRHLLKQDPSDRTTDYAGVGIKRACALIFYSAGRVAHIIAMLQSSRRWNS